LLAAWAVIIVLALQVAGAVLIFVFERHVVRTADQELDAHLNQLASMLMIDQSGTLVVGGELAEPRFRQPFSGRYWQVSSGENALLRSRSLWDVALPTNNAPLPGSDVVRREVAGPENTILRASIMTIILGNENGRGEEATYILVTAMNRSEIESLRSAFAADVIKALGGLGFLLIASAWLQVAIGLRPFETLRRGLESIRMGKARRLETENLVLELRPLATETNRLLDAQEATIATARERAGNLAHGVKTPLTALTMLAEQLRRDKQPGMAEEIEQQLRGLGQHVERELALSRIAARALMQNRTCILPVLAGLVRTMTKLPRGGEINWVVDCPADLAVSVDEVDLAEVLGNLLDNARKWASTKVQVAMHSSGALVHLSIDDDGHGLSVEDHARIVQRGRRLDERMPGSGLGLAITKEIVDAYHGSIQFLPSALGGLQVQIGLPAARDRNGL
jgi:signal transduction histidine kinase